MSINKDKINKKIMSEKMENLNKSENTGKSNIKENKEPRNKELTLRGLEESGLILRNLHRPQANGEDVHRGTSKKEQSITMIKTYHKYKKKRFMKGQYDQRRLKHTGTREKHAYQETGEDSV